jgi:hypothetical protein
VIRAIRALTLVAALVWVPRAYAQLLSPGPLNAAHGNLGGDDDCGKCHESGNKVVARLCLDCHKDLGAEMSASRGLHGKQFGGKPCEECHVEHLGKTSKLVRWPGGGMDKLDHGLTGWALDGGHVKVECLKCHTKTSPLTRVQFVGTNNACGACHKDPHGGKFSTECKKCHSTTEWKGFDQHAFDHKLARFPLTGKHAAVACEKCHTGTPPTWKPLQFATCESCHQDPHHGQFKPKPCTACHNTDSWNGAADAMRSNHPGLSLANGHAKVGCKACHDRGNDKPPSKGSKCESCHRPIHIARFGNRCETCHASILWVGLQESVGRSSHDKTRYPLMGKHIATECAGCHAKSAPVAQRYRNLKFNACGSCHRDKHNGEFKARDNGECAQCHTVNGFSPTRFGLVEHASVGFALDGKHAATPCGRCHGGAKPRLNWHVDKKLCADCHANPHGEQFAKEMAQGGCAQCHTAFDWHQPHIDHSSWPLVGAHTRTTCASCHGEQKVGAEPAAYRGIPRDCEGCHTDVHAGQFLEQPKKTCATCHDAFSFQIGQKFDHNKTRYALDGKHIRLECAQCHPKSELRNGATAVRWRLGYIECKDCHANPHKEAP